MSKRIFFGIKKKEQFLFNTIIYLSYILQWKHSREIMGIIFTFFSIQTILSLFFYLPYLPCTSMIL